MGFYPLIAKGQRNVLRGVDGQKKNMTFEKRETEGVRTTVPCVIRTQREMKEWRQRRWMGGKEQSWSSIYYLRCSYSILHVSEMAPSSEICANY